MEMVERGAGGERGERWNGREEHCEEWTAVTVVLNTDSHT